MTKIQFILDLNEKLSSLPKKEVEDRINFYVEMIEDKIEDGLNEEEAVASIGSVDEIASQIMQEIPISKIAKERLKPKRNLKKWEIALLILGAPIWFSLLLALVVVVFSLYVVLWAVIVAIWAVFVAFVSCALYGVISGIVFTITGRKLGGIALIGVGIACCGFGIITFYGCKVLTRCMINFTKKLTIKIKKLFVNNSEKKEEEA